MSNRGDVTCWKCQKKIGEPPMKIGFRAVCEHCEVDLHVCMNCRYHAPGKPNECEVPDTDYVSDRESSNLCEEFRLRQNSSTAGDLDKARKLFGDNEPQEKKGFDDLFKT